MTVCKAQRNHRKNLYTTIFSPSKNVRGSFRTCNNICRLHRRYPYHNPNASEYFLKYSFFLHYSLILRGWQRQFCMGSRSWKACNLNRSVMLAVDVLVLEPTEAMLSSHGSVDHKRWSLEGNYTGLRMHKEAGCGQGFTEPGYEHFENWITTVYHCELIWLVTSLVTGIVLAYSG